MEKYFKRDNCRLCLSADVEKVMPYVATPVGDHYVSDAEVGENQEVFPLDLYFCRNCGQLQLLDVVNPEAIYKDYLYETSTSLGLVEHFQKYAEDIIRRMNIVQGDFVVDIGCNDASFLKCFYDKGMKVLGIEPATEIAKKVATKNIDVMNEFFTCDLARRIKQKCGSAKMISANNVMANVEDMNDFVGGVSSLLAEDGIFIFESGYAVDTIRNSVMDNIYHEHLCYFRLNPLIKFFKKHGMEVFEVERVDTKGGSLRGVVQRIGGRRPVSPAVKARMLMEGSSGYDSVELYREFAARMEMIRCQVVELLEDLRKDGAVIAGYGASVGSTTLLYYYGANKYLNVLFDDNPIKQGLYSPGHHIPVVPSGEIYNRKPDHILIFPWRYVGPIKEKHRRYLEEGGHFIVPLPQVEVF